MEFYFVLFFLFYLSQGTIGAPPVYVTPERITLLEKRPLEVKCRVGVPITYCRFSVPGVSNALSLRSSLPPHEGIEYLGAGLDKGECGMLIRNVEAKHNGVIHCSMGFADEPTESTGNLTLIVAKAPDPPLLQVFPGVNYKDAFMEGEIVQANCRISNARPIANISWYLGSEPIYQSLSPTVKEEENGLMTISQNLTRKVSYTDNGKDLKCVAGHIALGEGSTNHSIHKLNVRFPPKPKSQELEKFGFIIGQPGKIVVTFQANPIPDILWKVDQDNLKQGTRDRTGRFEAGIIQHKGAGTWDAILNINSVRAEEVEKRYTLIAQNDLGRESYKVAISTGPEPPADITAGAIVGIVIAILVILLLVFMLIFARATGRWCFADVSPALTAALLASSVEETNRTEFGWKKLSSVEETNRTDSSFLPPKMPAEAVKAGETSGKDVFGSSTRRYNPKTGTKGNKSSSEVAIEDENEEKRPPSIQGKDGVYSSTEYINGNDKKCTDKINTPV